MKEKVIAILTALRPEFDFTADVNFMDEGMLDSFDMVNLVNELESQFGITIDGVDIIPENFSTLDSIVALLQKKGIN
jgi:acyl carrier protein